MTLNVNYRVVGLDPGGTTGAFVYDAEFMPKIDASGVELIGQTWNWYEFGPHEHHGELYEFLEHMHIHDFHLVYETFEFRNMERRDRDNINLMSREYIGVAKLFAHERNLGLGRVHKYSAGLSKGFIPDKRKDGLSANAKLKALNFYASGKKHANDAARVTAYYLINEARRTDLIRAWRHL